MFGSKCRKFAFFQSDNLVNVYLFFPVGYLWVAITVRQRIRFELIELFDVNDLVLTIYLRRS